MKLARKESVPEHQRNTAENLAASSSWLPILAYQPPHRSLRAEKPLTIPVIDPILLRHDWQQRFDLFGQFRICRSLLVNRVGLILNGLSIGSVRAVGVHRAKRRPLDTQADQLADLWLPLTAPGRRWCDRRPGDWMLYPHWL